MSHYDDFIRLTDVYKLHCQDASVEDVWVSDCNYGVIDDSGMWLQVEDAIVLKASPAISCILYKNNNPVGFVSKYRDSQMNRIFKVGDRLGGVTGAGVRAEFYQVGKSLTCTCGVKFTGGICSDWCDSLC